jgi:hypothetical protein
VNSEEKKKTGEKMSKKLSSNSMDDVDRLFQCFKCGISPPGEHFSLSSINRIMFCDCSNRDSLLLVVEFGI